MISEKIVKNLAGKWIKKLHPRSILDYDDLIQEAYVHMSKVKDKFDPTKSRYETFAWTSIDRRLKDIVCRENMICNTIEHPIVCQDDEKNEVEFESCAFIQENLEIKQAVMRLKDISPAFVDLMMNGVPAGLFEKVKVDIESSCKNKTRKKENVKFRIKRKILEQYLGCNLEILIKAYKSL
jgi:RNA polymerase sigma factor (sigma-70 family)